MHISHTGLGFYPECQTTELMAASYVLVISAMDAVTGKSKVTVTTPATNPLLFDNYLPGNLLYCLFASGNDNCILKIDNVSPTGAYITVWTRGTGLEAGTTLTYANGDRLQSLDVEPYAARLEYENTSGSGKVNGVAVPNTATEIEHIAGVAPLAFDGNFSINYQ